MFPGHIQDVRGAYFWVQDWLESIGGAIAPEPLHLDILVSSLDEEVGLELRPATVEIGEHTLTIQFVFNAQLEADTYRFDLRLTGSDDVAWRHDKHPGHEAEMGTDRHFHSMRFGKERRDAVADEPTFDEIARLIAVTL